MEWIEDRLEGLIVLGLGALLVFVLVMAVREETRWQQWASKHCRVVGEISGSSGTGLGMSSSGNPVIVSTYIPGKTGYQCDDGKTYWR